MMTISTQSCISTELRLALYRRAIACAYRDACQRQGFQIVLTLDALEFTSAQELEAHYVEEHGLERGVELACNILSGTVCSDFLELPPCLTPLRESMMADLCQKHLGIDRPLTAMH